MSRPRHADVLKPQKPKKTKKRGVPNMGRPKIVFTEEHWERLEEYCKLQCTVAECSLLLKVSEETLNRLILEKCGLTFSGFYELFKHEGKLSLRRMQILSAQAGSVPMQIHLGKHWLGQVDTARIDHTATVTHAVDADLVNKLKDASIDDLIALGKGLNKQGDV